MQRDSHEAYLIPKTTAPRSIYLFRERMQNRTESRIAFNQMQMSNAIKILMDMIRLQYSTKSSTNCQS